MATLLIPLPSFGFDPTESAVPWKRLRDDGHRVTFSTPDATPAQADPRVLTGQDLPLLFRKTLRAQDDAIAAYREMESSPEFKNPIPYSEAREPGFSGLLLPGGHDKGMRPYIESPELQSLIVEFFERSKPIAAICHGTLLVARSRLPDGKSVLYGRKTTGLTRNQELAAYFMTAYKLGDYYRTYPELLEDEVKRALRSPADFDRGPGTPLPTRRDSAHDLSPGFTVRDGNYLSARWPGDAHRFAADFSEMLKNGKHS